MPLANTTMSPGCAIERKNEWQRAHVSILRNSLGRRCLYGKKSFLRPPLVFENLAIVLSRASPLLHHQADAGMPHDDARGGEKAHPPHHHAQSGHIIPALWEGVPAHFGCCPPLLLVLVGTQLPTQPRPCSHPLTAQLRRCTGLPEELSYVVRKAAGAADLFLKVAALHAHTGHAE